MNIEITRAKPEDARGITNVLYTTWLNTYPNKEIGITLEDVAEMYKDSFTDKKLVEMSETIRNTPSNKIRLVAKENNEVIGTSMMEITDTHNHLHTLYVLPEHQGKGVGTQLWNEMKKNCETNKTTMLQVAIYNIPTIKFYEKLGFIDTGKRLTHERFKMPISGVRMPIMEMVLKN